MTKDEYMEAHHHATETAIGLIHVFMMAENYDKVNEHLTKCKQRLDEITQLRWEKLAAEQWVPYESELVDHHVHSGCDDWHNVNRFTDN